MSRAYDELRQEMDKAMAVKTAMTLFEWDNETLAPKEAGELTARVVGILSGEYFQAVTGERMKELLEQCEKEGSLSEAEAANVRELKEELLQIKYIPKEEYQDFARLTSQATSVWAEAKKNQDFEAFAPTLKKVIGYQKRFAGYRRENAGGGEEKALYDIMLDDYEKGFSMENLDRFFSPLKEELVPFLREVMECGKDIDDSFLSGGYPEKEQEKLGRFLAEYVGFDFDRGVLAVSAHPFTTNLHNKDVRITTHYTDRLDSSLFSVIHESGHAIYELGIRDELTLTPAGQGASMGMHESQSRFFENIIGRSRAFWAPIYSKVQDMFPEKLREISLDRFVEGINKIQPGLIRTEADELSYSLHVLIRYEIEKMLIEEELDVRKLPEIWADKYEEYLGIRPENAAEGVLQDIHWSQGSFGYFPSYALGSAFGAQLYFHMKKIMDFEGLLERGEIGVIREYLKENIHQYGKIKTSREILRDVTGEDFDPKYYVKYLKEKYSRLYGLTGK
ncbi:carboxypeptidase M32 [Lacrimispora sp. 210928-DFI.3.58]|uniref:carboxypeptidase M32 n=1 Tax=Lacrimispora sp. 210928-DFI.3.58 TaxID=2883214 RepID=UPI001D0760ED|nr:carboxypeptidase M32 [Lacrimispora sp. 210928-DFI.3.58]MCB7318596.1 carboxypeptidase M32 [Lacrimispora sp. 210928-DFI.3.58]